jgi:hypothetical protein
MKIIRPLTLLAALGSAMSALACDLPAEVDIPPGDEATLDEMLAAQTGVREYMAAMDEYLTCMDGELEALGEEATDEERAAMVEQYNTGVDLMEEVAAEFNEQRQLFQDSAAAEN